MVHKECAASKGNIAQDNARDSASRTCEAKDGKSLKSLKGTERWRQTLATAEPMVRKNDPDQLSAPDLEGSSEDSSTSEDSNERFKALFRGNFGKVKMEKLDIPKPEEPYRKISFASTHMLYVIPRTKQRLHQRIVRSRHDAWRKHGVLTKLHELGGWAFSAQQPHATKANLQFYEVKKGSQPPAPPKLPPILTIEDFVSRPIRVPGIGSKQLCSVTARPASPSHTPISASRPTLSNKKH